MHFTLLNLILHVFSDEIPEMIAHVDHINSCFCLTDASRPDYIFITNLRKRFGHFLHSASVSLRQQGEENTVDAVQTLVSKPLLINRSTDEFLGEVHANVFHGVCGQP